MNIYLQVNFMTVPFCQYLFYIPAIFKTFQFMKHLGIVLSLKDCVQHYSLSSRVVSQVSGRGNFRAGGPIGGNLNNSMLTYVDEDDNAVLAELVCVFVDLICSFSFSVYIT